MNENPAPTMSFSHNPPSIYRQRALENEVQSYGSVIGALTVIIVACILVCVMVFIARVCVWCLCGFRLPSEEPSAYPSSESALHLQQRMRQHSALAFDNGNLARQAGLSPGLLMAERIRILTSFFDARKCSYLVDGRDYGGRDALSNTSGNDVYCKDEEEEEDIDDNVDGKEEENVAEEEEEEEEQVVVGLDEDENDDSLKDKYCCETIHVEDKGSLSGRSSSDSIVATALNLFCGKSGRSPYQPDYYDSNSNTHMCSICLTDYTADDDQLIWGTQCSHVFHYQCCIEWLKEKDHCPCCRKEMVSPQEYRQAAVHTLGRERVNHLISSVVLAATTSPNSHR